MITREQIKIFLQNIASSHYNIHTFGWGDVPDLLAREKVIYPYMMVTPVPSTFEDGYINYGYLVSIADRIREGNQNEVEVDSDTFNIMMQVITQIDNLLYNDVDLVKGQTITPFMEAHRHRVSGHFSELQIRVKYNYDACAIPSDEVPLPLPPPPSCAVANYRVEYENGTLIEAGTIPSGGSKTIEVPDPSICANATWELRDEDGNLLDSGSVASGGSVTIEAPNADLLIRNSLNQTLYSLSLLSGSSGTQTIGDSSIRLEDSVGTLIANSSVVAEGSATIAAPNGVVSVRKSDGVEIYSVDVRSNGTASQNVADSVAVIKDSANTTLKSENIKATESENIVVNDSSVENSDASYSVNVLAEGSLVLPDSQINVNSVDAGDVVSVKTIDVNITDGVDPVTPTSVGLVGNTLTIEVPSGGGSYDLDLVDRFGNAFPTKQVTANAAWDLRTLTPFDFADLYLSRLSNPPTGAEETAYIQFITDQVTSGIFQRRIGIFPIIGGNSSDVLVNSAYPYNSELMSFDAKLLGAPTIDANGITINNGQCFIYAMSRISLPLNSLNVFVYSRTNNLPSSLAFDYTTQASNPQNYLGIRDNNNDRSFGGINGGINASGTNTDSRGGYHLNGILGTNACKTVKNGVTSSPLTTFTIGGAVNFTVHCFGSLFGTNAPNRQYAGFAVGLSLTDTQMQEDYTQWQALNTALNRQV
jgi:archaellum component FlaF (FlaF/FlaG flagellin family)